MGKVSGLFSVRCVTVQLISLPLSSGVGVSMYWLRMVTVLSELSTLTGADPLPLRAVFQVRVAGGRPLADSQLATATGDSPAGTVMIVAAFEGLAEGNKRSFNLYFTQAF